MKVTSAKLIGRSKPDQWLQVFLLDPHFYVVILVEDLDEIGDFSEIKNAVFNFRDQCTQNPKAISLAVLQQFTKELKASLSSFKNIEIGLACFSENAVYLTTIGKAEIAILRGADYATILYGKKDEFLSASGYIKDQDLLVIGTANFFSNFNQADLKEAFFSKDPFQAAKFLTSKDWFEKMDGGVAVAFLKFEENGDLKEEKQEIEKKAIEYKGGGRKIKVRGGEKHTLQNLIVRFKKIIQKFPLRKVYVRKETGEKPVLSQKKKVSASVGLIFLALLVISVGFGLWQKRKKDYELHYLTKLDQAEHELVQAQELYSVSPQRSRELFSQSRIRVQELVNEGIVDSRLDGLKQKLVASQKEILKEYQMAPELFVDLSLLSSGFKGEFISCSDEDCFVLDRESKKIAKVTIDSKRSEIIVGPSQIEEAAGLASYSGRVFVVKSQGIYEVGDRRVKVIERGWEGDVLAFAYASNIYVLEKSVSAIFRYAGTDNGFSSKQSWLTEGLELDLSDAKSMVIDGAIWVLDEKGNILKFTYGNLINFSLIGIFPPLTNVKAIYTSEDLEFLYLLDSGNSRVVVVNKEGEYKAQYISDEIKNAINLVVSEEEKKIILLTGEKLMSIQMEHL